ncbi:MAG: ABC transporter permease [Candidatus Zixiibacteriota bacterium]|nr:MAG: ABC transporter permease [candidate division Zixibacteria bacterium]
MNYLKVAVRSISKNKFFSVINVTGLAVGMAVCFLIMVWVQYELSYDKFHKDIDRTHMIFMRHKHSAGTMTISMTPAPLADALREKYREITSTARFKPLENVPMIRNNDKFIAKGAAADPQFLAMFTFPLESGDPESCLDDIHSILISRELAEKYFADSEPIGKTITIYNDYSFTVKGILENVSDNSTIRFDFVIPFSFLKNLGYDMERWDGNNFFTVVQIPPGVSHQSVSDKIKYFYKGIKGPETKIEIFLLPFESLHFLARWADDSINIAYVRFFSIVAIFILILACLNFMNLTTSSAGKRAREIGMRKVVGAARRQIAWQMIGESVLFAVCGMAIAVMLVELSLPHLSGIFGKELSLGKIGFFKLAITIILITVGTGFLAGSYPAIVLSSYNPVSIFKKQAGPGKNRVHLRRTMVILQFCISIALFSGAIIVSQQIHMITTKKLGLNKENLIYMPFNGNSLEKFESFKNELLNNPDIKNVCLSSHLPTYVGSNSSGWEWDGKTDDEKALIGVCSFSYDTENTLGLEMVGGRFFDRRYPSDTINGIVINEEAARLIGFKDPVGNTLRNGDETFNIIGVVKDFHYKPLTRSLDPLAILNYPDWSEYIIIKISGSDASAAVEYIKSKFGDHFPHLSADLGFLDEKYAELYRKEQLMKKLIGIFSILAVFIAGLGLLGMITFATESRTKEIGIRKVLGATVSGIIRLLINEIVILITIANLIALPISYYFMNRWLENYIYRVDIGWTVFAASGLAALLLALFTISFQTVKTALANPVKSLKYE